MFVDIAFNGTDTVFEKDIENIMERARKVNVMPIIVGVDLDSSQNAIDMALKYNTFCYFGIHPLHFNYENIKDINLKDMFLKVVYEKTNNIFVKCNKIENDMKDEKNTNENNNCVFSTGLEHTNIMVNDYNHNQILNSILAIGECGLDYYRASNKEEQIEVFKKHIILGRITGKSFFLHCRAAFDDFYKIIRNGIKGIVHSFDGSTEEMFKLVESGFYIGINGCSTKTSANIEMIKQLPVDKILLETDSPYCCIRKSYESQKYTEKLKIKNNEPCYIRTIAVAVANIKGISIEELENIILKNTLTLFPQIKDKIKYWKNNKK